MMQEAKSRKELELETQLKTARDKVAYLYARWQEPDTGVVRI